MQEKEFERLGGEKKIKSNTRIITATNKDLWKLVQAGSFREDLYYRLSVATIKVPPLRERKSDIPLLVEHILRKINHDLGKDIRKIEEKALKRIMEYDWPGNVRELENLLTHVAINTQGEVILEEAITPMLGEKFQNHQNQNNKQKLKDIEKDHITEVLNRTHWHFGKACGLLGISRPTLRHKIRAYGISSDPHTT